MALLKLSHFLKLLAVLQLEQFHFFCLSLVVAHDIGQFKVNFFELRNLLLLLEFVEPGV